MTLPKGKTKLGLSYSKKRAFDRMPAEHSDATGYFGGGPELFESLAATSKEDMLVWWGLIAARCSTSLIFHAMCIIATSRRITKEFAASKEAGGTAIRDLAEGAILTEGEGRALDDHVDEICC